MGTGGGAPNLGRGFVLEAEPDMWMEWGGSSRLEVGVKTEAWRRGLGKGVGRKPRPPCQIPASTAGPENGALV